MDAALNVQLVAPDPHIDPLSAREREVAVLVSRGFTNRQIASDLVISERTVAAHVEHILAKLGFASRTQIGVWAAGIGRTTDAASATEV